MSHVLGEVVEQADAKRARGDIGLTLDCASPPVDERLSQRGVELPRRKNGAGEEDGRRAEFVFEEQRLAQREQVLESGARLEDGRPDRAKGFPGRAEIRRIDLFPIALEMGAREHDGSGILRFRALASGTGRFDGLVELALVIEGEGPRQVRAAGQRWLCHCQRQKSHKSGAEG